MPGDTSRYETIIAEPATLGKKKEWKNGEVLEGVLSP
jgi:hypothetical protein